MRRFENYLYGKIKELKENILYIDLADYTIERGCIEINLGLKKAYGGHIGTLWEGAYTTVDDDFTMEEFILTCEKYNLQYSVACGDNKKLSKLKQIGFR